MTETIEIPACLEKWETVCPDCGSCRVHVVKGARGAVSIEEDIEFGNRLTYWKSFSGPEHVYYVYECHTCGTPRYAGEGAESCDDE